jgi:predicted transcriptional regulator of viral defense system
VATKLAPDAVVAYHAALEFWGKAYSVWRRLHYFTSGRLRGFRFRDLEFIPVQAPRAVREGADYMLGVVEQRHGGGVVRVTTLERTLVDVLASPANAGGWEEIWRSLEMVEFFDLDAVVTYALKLNSALTVARVGFFLEQHRDTLMVDDAHLEQLRLHRPRQPRYLDQSRESGTLIPAWNLVVPPRVMKRAWMEVS